MTPEEKQQKKIRSGKGKKRIRRIALILVILVISASAGLFAVDRLKEKYTVTYEEYTAVIGTISNSLSFSGTLQVLNNASYTASSSATVRTVNVKNGQDVKQGDILMRLSNGQNIQAEFDGRVNQLPVKANEKVPSGSDLIQVVDFTHMKVSIRVDEYDISDVHVGDACRITTTATENTFDSVIADINYVSSSGGAVAYYTATAYVDVTEGVYPGMQVTVTVPQEEAENVVVLREDALSFSSNNQAYVYSMNAAGEMVECSVVTGVSNGNYVEIREGLQAGDLVYVKVQTQTESSVTNLLTSIFGGQRVNGFGNSRNGINNTNTNRNNTRSPQNMPGRNGGGQ